MATVTSSATDRFHTLAAQILGDETLTVDPWLHRYCGSTGSPGGADKYLRYQQDLLDLAGLSPEGKVVVDAGSGFGFTMLVYAVLGAATVRGIELHEGMVSTVQAYLPTLPPDIAARIEVTHGSVFEMPYEDGSADILLSIEAISHYLDVDRFLREAQRVLAPGGTLIVADGNNASNPFHRRRVANLWEAFENGPTGRQMYGHVVEVPYVDRRRDLLARELPDLDPAAAQQIAKLTAGFLEEQVLTAGRRYLETGALPNAPYRRGQLAVDPEGQVMERLFSPTGLARKLRGLGFDAKAYGYWGGASGSAPLRVANQVLATLAPLTIPSARSFRVIARKPA